PVERMDRAAEHLGAVDLQALAKLLDQRGARGVEAEHGPGVRINLGGLHPVPKRSDAAVGDEGPAGDVQKLLLDLVGDRRQWPSEGPIAIVARAALETATDGATEDGPKGAPGGHGVMNSSSSAAWLISAVNSPASACSSRVIDFLIA